MSLIKTIINNRSILLNLILADFKNRYLGSHLGFIWAIIQPLVMVLVYWFVFTKGLRVGSVSDSPFLLWLLSGLLPWFILNDAILTASNAVVSQSFLVKKIVFEVKLLPVIKIGSSLLVSLAFWLLLPLISIGYGYYPSLIWFQLLYFIICILLLSLSVGMMLAAVIPFVPDIAQLLIMLFQVLFWATPVLWNQNMLIHHPIMQYIIKLNPFAYIVDGFRDVIITKTPFWHFYNQMVYFWLVLIILYWLSNKLFNKLSPHFADVL